MPGWLSAVVPALALTGAVGLAFSAWVAILALRSLGEDRPWLARTDGKDGARGALIFVAWALAAAFVVGLFVA